MSANTLNEYKETKIKSEKINDYVESIENDVSEIKFFLAQIFKLITVYKEKKGEYKEEIENLNSTISNLKENEIKLKHEIEMLNKTIQSLKEKEKQYTEQFKQLEQKLNSRLERERQLQSQSSGLPSNVRHNPAPNMNTNQKTHQSNKAQVTSPSVFFEKNPIYNDLHVSTVINPFRNIRN